MATTRSVYTTPESGEFWVRHGQRFTEDCDWPEGGITYGAFDFEELDYTLVYVGDYTDEQIANYDHSRQEN